MARTRLLNPACDSCQPRFHRAHSWSPRMSCGSVRHKAPLSSDSGGGAALVQHLLCARRTRTCGLSLFKDSCHIQKTKMLSVVQGHKVTSSRSCYHGAGPERRAVVCQALSHCPAHRNEAGLPQPPTSLCRQEHGSREGPRS